MRLVKLTFMHEDRDLHFLDNNIRYSIRYVSSHDEYIYLHKNGEKCIVMAFELL